MMLSTLILSLIWTKTVDKTGTEMSNFFSVRLEGLKYIVIRITTEISQNTISYNIVQYI